MRATTGDRIVIETTTLTSRRHGEVVEVIGTGEREHYRVRWTTDTESNDRPRSSMRGVPPS